MGDYGNASGQGAERVGLGEFQFAQGLRETVAVSGQVQLIQNVQHRGMLVEGEEVQPGAPASITARHWFSA